MNGLETLEGALYIIALIALTAVSFAAIKELIEYLFEEIYPQTSKRISAIISLPSAVGLLYLANYLGSSVELF